MDKTVKKLLFVCSENRLRSATAEAVFSGYEGVEAIGAGTNKDAATPVAVFALVLITTSAQATDKGNYVSGNVGLSLVPELEQEIQGNPLSDISLDLGFRFGVALGYDFGDWRAEGEVAYRLNDTDDGDFGIGSGPVKGDVSALSFMINVYYDFHMANSPLVPYLGVGVGFSKVSADVSAPFLSPLPLFKDSATVFAAQFMAGLGFNVSPNVILTADYRYFITENPEFEPGSAFVPGTPNIESDYSNHSFNVGARFMF